MVRIPLQSQRDLRDPSESFPGVSPAENQDLEDRGIEILKRLAGGFKKPKPRKGGKAKTKIRHLEPQYSFNNEW